MKLKKLILTTAAIAAAAFSANSYANSGLIGTVVTYAMDAEPPGCIPADGRQYSQAQYPDLYKAIGAHYGSAGGNPKVPDYRGYFLRGWHGEAGGRDPDVGSRGNRGDGLTGSHIGTKQGDMFRSHTHSYGGDDTLATHGYRQLSYRGFDLVSQSGPNWRGGDFASSAAGGAETRPKNIYVGYCIIADDKAFLSHYVTTEDYNAKITELNTTVTQYQTTIDGDVNSYLTDNLTAHLSETLKDDMEKNGSEYFKAALKAQYQDEISTKFKPAGPNTDNHGAFYVAGFETTTNPYSNEQELRIKPVDGLTQACYQSDSSKPIPDTSDVYLNMKQANATVIAAYIFSAYATGKPVIITGDSVIYNGKPRCYINQLDTAYGIDKMKA